MYGQQLYYRGNIYRFYRKKNLTLDIEFDYNAGIAPYVQEKRYVKKCYDWIADQNNNSSDLQSLYFWLKIYTS